MILKTYQGIEARGNDEGSFPFPPNYLVVGITFIASFFSFLHIGQKSMWFDEVHSVFFAGLPWSELWAVLSSMEANSELYYVLLKFWLVFGDSEFAVRALSALFAVASVPVLYGLARRLFGIRAGLVAIILLSVNAFFIEYAQRRELTAWRFFWLCHLPTCSSEAGRRTIQQEIFLRLRLYQCHFRVCSFFRSSCVIDANHIRSISPIK